MKRALFISHVPPFPTIGGDRVRIAQSLRLLTELYDVDIVYITNTPDDKPMKDYLPEIKGERRFYTPKAGRYLRGLKALVNRRSLIENLFLHPAMLRYVKRVAPDYDLVFCASPVTAQYALASNVNDTVLDMTDALSMNYSNAAAKAKGWQKRVFREESRRFRRFEEVCRDRFRSIAYISDVDRKWVGGNNGSIVGNAAQFAPGKQSKRNVKNNHLVFVGKMNYEPNIRAVSFFACEVMPLLRKRIPDIRFSIVGVSPTAEVRSLAELPGVEVTGFVDSLDPWFEEASIVVAPMLSGSGVQNKILEALSYGCIVMTTPIGLEGIESLSDVMTVVRPNPKEWADAIIYILRNPKIASAKAAVAPAKVISLFGMEKIRTQFRNFLNCTRLGN